MDRYKNLNKQVYQFEDYKLLPIRFVDRYDIMEWRNEQIYHLRQQKPLLKNDQDRYFENTIKKIFKENQPPQILFSLLKNDICIGYGGLVHINWIDKNAEISFIMNTKLEALYFEINWSIFLSFIDEMAFGELGFHKIYVYAFDLRKHLYSTLQKNNFKHDATLTDHCFINEKFKDVVIYSKIKSI